MKKAFFICATVVMIILTCAFNYQQCITCNIKEKNIFKFYDDLNKLPKEYTLENALQNGDVIALGNTDYNGIKFYEFYDKYKSGKLKNGEMIRITKYSAEGDAIISDLIYDESGLHFFIDSTRNKSLLPIDRIIKEHKIMDIFIEEKWNRNFYNGKTSDNEDIVIVSLKK